MKEVGIRIRIEPELRDAFMAVCRSRDVPAARVIRSFIKDYVLQHQSAASSSISFTTAPLDFPESNP